MSARERALRLGRNDPCPCGSGRKVKKCCGTEEARRASDEVERRAAEEADRQMHNEMREIVEAEQERQRRYGKVRPIISARCQDHQFVAVGNRLYYDKKWANFTDFLFFYVKDVMGKEWWLAEAAKSPNERPPIVKWHDHLVETQRGQQPDPETGLFSAVKDGILSALLTLAYDLLRPPELFKAAR
jgi:hypothetical protein